MRRGLDAAKEAEAAHVAVQAVVANNGWSHNKDIETCGALVLQRQGIAKIGSSLELFTNLVRLDLSRNMLTSLDGLGHLSNLEELNVYLNKIDDAREILKLRKLPKLRKLDARLNPVVRSRLYRSFVVQHLEDLEDLDEQPVSAFERRKANELPPIAAGDLQPNLDSDDEGETSDETSDRDSDSDEGNETNERNGPEVLPNHQQRFQEHGRDHQVQLKLQDQSQNHYQEEDYSDSDDEDEEDEEDIDRTDYKSLVLDRDEVGRSKVVAYAGHDASQEDLRKSNLSNSPSERMMNSQRPSSALAASRLSMRSDSVKHNKENANSAQKNLDTSTASAPVKLSRSTGGQKAVASKRPHVKIIEPAQEIHSWAGLQQKKESTMSLAEAEDEGEAESVLNADQVLLELLRHMRSLRMPVTQSSWEDTVAGVNERLVRLVQSRKTEKQSWEAERQSHRNTVARFNQERSALSNTERTLREQLELLADRCTALEHEKAAVEGRLQIAEETNQRQTAAAAHAASTRESDEDSKALANMLKESHSALIATNETLRSQLHDLKEQYEADEAQWQRNFNNLRHTISSLTPSQEN
mmetsp:Transcript_21400/g.41962  ORF Transcript_21400/g.41962 Transcript_21400/m.41962 type:complete len:583 (+) Transcript_21400:130-1878(+)